MNNNFIINEDGSFTPPTYKYNIYLNDSPGLDYIGMFCLKENLGKIPSGLLGLYYSKFHAPEKRKNFISVAETYFKTYPEMTKIKYRKDTNIFGAIEVISSDVEINGLNIENSKIICSF